METSLTAILSVLSDASFTGSSCLVIVSRFFVIRRWATSICSFSHPCAVTISFLLNWGTGQGAIKSCSTFCLVMRRHAMVLSELRRWICALFCWVWLFIPAAWSVVSALFAIWAVQRLVMIGVYWVRIWPKWPLLWGRRTISRVFECRNGDRRRALGTGFWFTALMAVFSFSKWRNPVAYCRIDFPGAEPSSSCILSNTWSWTPTKKWRYPNSLAQFSTGIIIFVHPIGRFYLKAKVIVCCGRDTLGFVNRFLKTPLRKVCTKVKAAETSCLPLLEKIFMNSFRNASKLLHSLKETLRRFGAPGLPYCYRWSWEEHQSSPRPLLAFSLRLHHLLFSET